MNLLLELEAAGAMLPPAARRVLSDVSLPFARLQAENLQLAARLRDLEVRLGQTSQNSSRPPSSDPPGAPPAPPKPKSGRKRGAQKGHRGHHRSLLPREEVDQVVVCLPEVCRHCCTSLAGARPVGRPWRHQVSELPPIRAVVTEYQAVKCRCPSCGRTTRGALPREVAGHSLGARLVALLAQLSSRRRLSRRQVQGLLADLLGEGRAPSLGSVQAALFETSAALLPAYAEIRTAVRAAPALNVDETSWWLRGRKSWLWAATAPEATLFHLAPTRSRAAYYRLLGPRYAGLLSSDRYGVYHAHPLESRQLCWADLKRDFAHLVERGPQRLLRFEAPPLQVAARGPARDLHPEAALDQLRHCTARPQVEGQLQLLGALVPEQLRNVRCLPRQQLGARPLGAPPGLGRQRRFASGAVRLYPLADRLPRNPQQPLHLGAGRTRLDRRNRTAAKLLLGGRLLAPRVAWLYHDRKDVSRFYKAKDVSCSE